MGAPASTGIPRLTSATVTQYLASQRRLTQAAQVGSEHHEVVLLRSTPQWDGPAQTTWGKDRRARVVAAPSALAVHEQILDHLSHGAASDTALLVVLTDQEDAELDPGLLARAYRKRVESVDGWDVVREAFGAASVDPRLKDEAWAAEALLDAIPPEGWPQLPGGVLSRREALTRLALRRLQADVTANSRRARGNGRLDTYALLRWSLNPGGPESLLSLRKPERDGLMTFLGEEDQGGSAGRALMALVAADHGADAVAFGVICAALWKHASADADTYRARGRAERWLGDTPPATGDELDHLITSLGVASEEFVGTLLAIDESGEGSEDSRREARRLSETALAKAGILVEQFAAEQAAQASPVLTAGLEARFATAGDALMVQEPIRVADAVTALADHALSDNPDERVRIGRAWMAQRLVQWLATRPGTEVTSIGDAIERQIEETGWVDRALEHLEAGGDPEPRLKAAYDGLGRRVRALRRELDGSFARALAAWSKSGTSPGSMLTVETFLQRIVKPVVQKADRRVLLLVLDGMSSAIAVELGDELRRSWAEFDPYTGSDKGRARRRAMAAALPTLTAVSRTSLLTGRLARGSQADEKREFGALTLWGGAKAAIFHKDDLRGDATGAPFGPELTDALADGETHVAVVLNTIDDRLAKEQKLGDGAWTVDEIGGLRPLLREAAAQGMAVLLTSDHGHVVDRHPVRAQASGGEIVSARHRTPGGPLGETEVELSGPRVVWPESDGSIVTLWDADSRYTAMKAGYHGGASLAEFAIPVLAFLPFSAEPPTGWRELGEPQPPWWSLEGVPTPDEMAGQPAPVSKATVKTKRTAPKQPPQSETDTLFRVEPTPSDGDMRPAPEPGAGATALVAALLGSEVFQGQMEGLARKPGEVQLRKALTALVDAGTLPMTALAQRADVAARRAAGFGAVLSQLLNYDGVQVLQTLPDGRTLKLDAGLLKKQFGLG